MSLYIVLARDPRGEGVALGPFMSRQTASACADEVCDKQGWEYDDTVPLMSGADLKWRKVPGEGDAKTATPAERRRILCAHADDGQPMHWLEPGEKCDHPTDDNGRRKS